MKFNRRFYNSEVNFKAISTRRFALSVLLGLASAILIYYFFYVLRETGRMMTLDLENRPIIIPEADREYYNLFFAAISMIIGNSIAISFLISRPQNIFSRKNFKRNRIINDQSFLGANFIHWFAKIWFMFAAFAVEYMGSEFIAIFFVPLILLIIVLYFDSWKSLILVIKKNRLKIQLIHLLVFLTFTYALSQVNIFDYKSFDASIRLKNPSVDVPSSFIEKDYHQRRYYDHLVFKMDFISDNEIGIFTMENKRIKLNEIYDEIIDREEYMGEEVKDRYSPRLRANKNLPIGHIKEFESVLFKLGKYSIIYEVENKDESTSQLYNNQIRRLIQGSLKDGLLMLENVPSHIFVWDYRKDSKITDILRIDISKGVIALNDNIISLNEISEMMKSYINEYTVFEYVYHDSATYQDYINVVSAHQKAVFELRDTENYSTIISEINRNQFNRDEKLNEERDRIMDKYPIKITERFN